MLDLIHSWHHSTPARICFQCLTPLIAFCGAKNCQCRRIMHFQVLTFGLSVFAAKHLEVKWRSYSRSCEKNLANKCANHFQCCLKEKYKELKIGDSKMCHLCCSEHTLFGAPQIWETSNWEYTPAGFWKNTHTHKCNETRFGFASSVTKKKYSTYSPSRFPIFCGLTHWNTRKLFFQ